MAQAQPCAAKGDGAGSPAPLEELGEFALVHPNLLSDILTDIPPSIPPRSSVFKPVYTSKTPLSEDRIGFSDRRCIGSGQ
jgi:hypothetical protein